VRQLAALAGNVSADSWDFVPPASARETAELAPLTQALQNVLQRLERSFLQQRTFVSDAAHELKTAVAVVKSSLQLVGMRPRTAEEYQTGNERALADTERIEELVGKMLTLARVEGSAAAIADETCNLQECVCRTARELETFASVRQVEVTVSELAAGSCYVPLNGEDCALIVSNLLMNAIQHSPRQARVDVKVCAQAEYFELTVHDRGDGIDPTALPHVFDRFFRGDPSRNRATGGTGLGLAICKAAVERAGGTITLASEPSKGTTATVRLPRIAV
jgi:signal transduction histidine kinase